MFPVAAAAAAGWLILFVLLLAAPPPPPGRRRAGAGDPAPVHQGDEPPAVVSLLAGRLGRFGFGATLLDLAARGWFRLSPPARHAGAAGHAGASGPTGPGQAGGAPGTVMCVVCAEPPDERLTPYEQRVVAHVGLRAGADGEVPGPALAEGFAGGEAEFMKEFREEVDADARRRGLTRSRLSPGRIVVLCVLLFVPAGTLLAAIDPAHRKAAWAYLGFSYFFAFGLTVKTGTSRRCSAAGRAARSRWRQAVARRPGGGGRLEAYAAALGVAPDAVAVFAPAGQDLLWSSYRGSWQQIAVEKNTWPWPKAVVIVLVIIFGPILYLVAVFWLFAHGMAGTAERVIGLTAAAAVGFAAWVATRSAQPRVAEFDGQVIRQMFVKGGDDSPDEYHVLVDDGVRATAWDFSVGSVPYRRLTPGTFVHVRVDLRSKEHAAVEPVGPPAVARPLAGVAAQQQRASHGGLPNPADLVPADDAGWVLGGPVAGEHIPNPAGQTVTWQAAGRDQLMLTVIVRQARPPLGPRPLPGAWPVPGTAGGYLLDGRAWLYAGPLVMIISIRGQVAAGNEACLAWLLPRTEARLHHWLAGTVADGETDDRSVSG
jgi:hypothetical protein